MSNIPDKLDAIQLAAEDLAILICPQLPGCFTQGADKDSAALRLRDAISAYVESQRRHAEELAVAEVKSNQLVPEYDLDSQTAKDFYWEILRFGGWEIDHQTSEHLVFRISESPPRRLTLPIPEELSTRSLGLALWHAGITPADIHAWRSARKRPGHDMVRQGRFDTDAELRDAE